MNRKKSFLWTLWALALVTSVGALVLTSCPQESLPASALPAETGGYVALTFDDGPRRETTEALLEGLAQRGAHATFFLIGDQVEAHRDLVLRMAAEGHQIGLHTWDHVSLRGAAREVVLGQLELSRQVLTELLGTRDFMLRPPYGFVDDQLTRLAQAPIICWSVDTLDWEDPDPARITALCLEEARDGSILLLHDIYPTSVEAALAAVDGLMARGFRCVTVEELFALRGLTPEQGTVYGSLPPPSGP